MRVGSDVGRFAGVMGVVTAVALLPIPSPAWSAPGPRTPTFSVQSTLVLPTNTVHPGNYLNYSPGGDPYSVVIDPVNGLTYVTDLNVPQLYVVNSSSHRLLTTYRFSAGLAGMALDPTTNELFIAESAVNRLATFDASAGRLVRETVVGVRPIGVLFDPLNSRVYVANSGSGNVSGVNVATGKVTAYIKAETGPQWLAADFAHQRLYVSTEACTNGTYNISVVNLSVSKRVGDIPVTEYPAPSGCGSPNGQLLFDPGHSRLYFAETYNFTVAILDPARAKVVSVVSLAFNGSYAQPFGLALDASHHRLAIGDRFNGNVSFLDTATGRLFAGTTPNAYGVVNGIAYDPVHRSWTFGSVGPPTIRTLSATNLSRESLIRLSAQPTVAVYDPVNRDAYFYDLTVGLDVVSSVSHRLVARIGGVSGYAMAVDPKSGVVYAADGSGTVDSIYASAQAVANRTTDSSWPIGLAFDSATHELWAVGGSTGEVVVFYGSNLSVAARIAAPKHSVGEAITYDPSNDRIYAAVGNTILGTNTLEVFSGSFRHRIASTPMSNSSGVIQAMTVDPSAHRVYAIDSSGDLSVLDARTNKIVNTSSVLGAPYGIVFDPLTGNLYVTDASYFVNPAFVLEVNATSYSVMASVQVGVIPYGIVYAPGARLLLVANDASSTISFVNP